MWQCGQNRRRRDSKYRGAVVCGAVWLVVCGGCEKRGDKYARLPFSGTVTLDGKPLLSGYVIFEPKSGQPTQSGGMISGGKFDVPQKSGAVAGKYSVAIFSGAESSPGKADAGTPEAEAAAKRIRGEQVPRKYNIDSILTVEISPGKDNTFPFELSTR
jgi:hypothetical protein